MTKEAAIDLSCTLLAFARGEVVEMRHKLSVGDIWFDMPAEHSLDCGTYEYRIKP